MAASDDFFISKVLKPVFFWEQFWQNASYVMKVIKSYWQLVSFELETPGLINRMSHKSW